MIRLENVTKRFGDTIAVDNLSFEVNQGEVCVLIGPSGCGKTTTLRMINRMTEPTSGRIFINGKDTSTEKPEVLRRAIGYAIQSVGLFPHLTVARNIATVPELLHWDEKRIARRVEELLLLVGLNPAQYARKYPHQLSGGEAQRIGVARALAADPSVLLMDEPFGAVDPLTRERLQTQFARIQQELKKTVIMVTHDLDEAIRLADRIAIMKSGRLVQYDTPEALLTKPANKFVHDFVGTDRALKRLSRLPIMPYVRQAPSVTMNATMEEIEAVCRHCQWVWVVNDQKRLLGWLDRGSIPSASSVSDVIVRGTPEEIAVTGKATLREALSRMLGQGLRSIPVVDEMGILLGEITLRDIEMATAGTDTAP